MRADILKRKGAAMCCMVLITLSALAGNPVYADTLNNEDLISNINVPETGVIQYDVVVPAGSTVNYSVELTPDKKTGTIDKISGVWKNTTKKTVTKTINAKVKFLSSEYTISATCTSNSTQYKLEYKDRDIAVKSYEESTIKSNLSWDTGDFEKWCDLLENQFKKVSEYIR